MSSDNPQDPADKLRQKIAALQAKLKKQEATGRKRLRKEEDARKYETGAIALAIMDEDPKCETARQIIHRLNDNVPNYRRHLFAQYGITPDPPPGSNAERRSFKSGKKKAPANDSTDPATLKRKFKA